VLLDTIASIIHHREPDMANARHGSPKGDAIMSSVLAGAIAGGSEISVTYPAECAILFPYSLEKCF